MKLRLDNILSAFDFSSCAQQALAVALELASHADARLHMLYADASPGTATASGGSPACVPARLRERLERIAERRLAALDLERLHIEHAVTRGMEAAAAILDYATEQDVDLIAMGARGRPGPGHTLLGHVAENVVRLAPCPVLTVHPGEGYEEPVRVHSILVPVDLSEHSRLAIRHAGALAALYGARLDLLHVVNPVVHPVFHQTQVFSIYDLHPDFDAQIRDHLERLYEEHAGFYGLSAHVEVHAGHAAHEILRYARTRHSDLIVMGTHGLTGLEHFLMGSVTEKVVRYAPCPVLTIKSFGKSLLPPVQAAEALELYAS